MAAMKVVLFAVLYGLFALSVGSQEVPNAATLNAKAVAAYQAKDYYAFLKLEQQAHELEPKNPQIVYNLACGEALNGHPAEAIQFLDKLLQQKLDFGAETDPDLTSARSSPEWKAFETRLAALRKPLIRSQVAFTLPDPELLATGMASDPETGDIFVASVRKRKILRRTPHGEVSDFIHQGQDGFLAGDSLAVDVPRRLLYATTSAAPYMVRYEKTDYGHSGLFAFDLKSGKLARKAMLPADGKRHLLNALAIDHDGNVYVSDSGVSGIYLLRRTSSTLEEFLPASVFEATQGLALSKDDKTLFVADYASGLWAVDIASRQSRKLDPPSGTWLRGLDGISSSQNGFIAVQIGAKPERVLRIRVDPAAKRVTSVEILEMSHPDYEGPIQGTVVGNSFLYVANSQLDLGDGKTGAFASERAQPTVVLRLPL
jgi:sugar lactone lactonase YvrE